MSKILEGLDQALAYARCKHKFTKWKRGKIMDGTVKTRPWRRTCTKCKARETKFDVKEPA